MLTFYWGINPNAVFTCHLFTKYERERNGNMLLKKKKKQIPTSFVLIVLITIMKI